MSDPLSGQVAIVTGGASGIGEATCRALKARGARVVAVDVSPAKLEERRRNGGCDEALALDVRREEEMERMARETLERFGRIDILVASAGILRGTGSTPRPLANVSLDEWEQVIETNLRGTFLSNRAVLPAMLKQRRGNIVNISSVSGLKGRAFDAPYCASKFGVIGMSESLAEEVRNSGIRVQIVLPDAVDTPMWDQNGPVPRPPNAVSPERVAEVIVYLLAQPADTVIPSVVVAPFRTRRGVGAKYRDKGEETKEES
jgi:NAD(P)-dependent dehydrogenase (short-subunit alcohol dehydrogenase family)